MATDLQINGLPSDWCIGVIGRDAEIKGRIGWRGYKKSDLRQSGPVVIGGINVKSHVFLDLTDIKHLSREKFEESPDIRLLPGDVVMVQRGNGLADTALYQGNPYEATINPTLVIFSNFTGDSRFLFYYFKSPIGREKVLALASGSSVPALYQSHLKQLTYPKPPVQEQRAIADALFSLDEKIELNRRMSETLEEMARALFKSWFVDFDPVRAKAEGRDTGLPADIAALFPDSFEDSELGEVPAGWSVSTLGALIELRYGKALKGEHRVRGVVPVFGSNGQIGWHNAKLADGPGIVVGRKGNPGVVKWAPTDFFVIDTAFYAVPRTPNFGLHFLFFALEAQRLELLGADSAVPGLNREIAYLSKQLVPTDAILLRFEEFSRRLFEKAGMCRAESRMLIELRDALLPKLISGEVRVGDAMSLAASAAQKA